MYNLDELVKEVQSLKSIPRPCDIDKTIPDYLRIWNTYARRLIYGDNFSAVSLDDFLEDKEYVFSPHEYVEDTSTPRSSDTYNRMFLLLALAKFNKDTKGGVGCASSVREKRNFTKGKMGVSVEDNAISDIVIVSKSPNLKIYLDTRCDIIWKVKKIPDDESYEYRPIDYRGEEAFKFPYIFPLTRDTTISPNSLTITIEDDNESMEAPEACIYYNRYWFPVFVVKKFHQGPIILRSSKDSYLLLKCDISFIEPVVASWKNGITGTYMRAQTRAKLLKFLNLLHQKDTSTIGRHMNGIMGETRLLRVIFSFLSDVDP